MMTTAVGNWHEHFILSVFVDAVSFSRRSQRVTAAGDGGAEWRF